MKSDNIVKKLEKEGYKIFYKKWGYWDSIPHVQLNGFDFAIAEYIHQNNWLGCNLDFIFNQVQEALDIAQRNNPLFIKKIEQVPFEQWYYSRFLILSMEDYFLYKKNLHPFDDEYYAALEKLKKDLE